MKMTETLEAAFNDQITLELGAATTYRQLAIEVDVRDLPGMAAWLRHQADEEIVHANKFIDHMVDRDMHPKIGATSAPPSFFAFVQAVFEAALAHEEKVSASIRALYRTADSEGDLDSRPLLAWFLEEQIEEEATVSAIIGRLRLIGDDGSGLLRLDSELGQRQPATTENTGS